MINYEILKENKAIKKSISLVSDRLYERIFATENVYINGKLKTHSGIINKSTQQITDKSCNESEITLNYDGTINKFIVTITKKNICKTNIYFNLNTKRLRAQIALINNSDFIQCVELHDIHLESSIINIKPHDFIVLDTVCIANCCTGAFEKQPDTDIIRNRKLNKVDLNSEFFSKTLRKLELGNLENVQNNQNISNSILISKDTKFVLNEIDKSKIIYIQNTDVQLELNRFSNINVFIENHADTININLLKKTKRGFVSIINKTSKSINVNFTNNAPINIEKYTKLTVGYSPYNNFLSIFTSLYNIDNGNNITSETLYEGINEFTYLV